MIPRPFLLYWACQPSASAPLAARAAGEPAINAATTTTLISDSTVKILRNSARVRQEPTIQATTRTGP